MTARARPWALLLALLVALFAVAGALVPARPASSQAPEGSGPSADCTDGLEVLLLIDESASLKTTDPENRRVEAAEVLVRSLASSAEASGGSVNVTIAGFGSSVSEVGRVALPAQAADAVGVVQTFTTRNTERNTDYVLALRYAVDHFRALDVPPECKRLVWFTDGAYSIDDLTAPGLATYSSSTDKAAFQSELEGQICGPLPGPSRLTNPVSAQIRTAGFVVQLVDFRVSGRETETERQERDNTTAVIDRLLGGDGADPCRVRGDRVEAGQASALADEFFNQGQIALGRRVVACTDLTNGYPTALVRAASARGATGATITILRDGQPVASGTGFATYSAPPDEPAAGLVTATTSSGSLAGCYADLTATVVPVDEATVVRGASTSLVRIGIRGGTGLADPSSLVGPDAVSVDARANGTPVAVEWQEPTRTWQISVPGPITDPPELVVSVTTPGWGELTSAALDVTVQDAPPRPRVVWNGPSTLEGSGTFTGRLTVLPGAVTGGTVCVLFGTPTIDVAGVQLLLGTNEACGADDAPFDLAAEIVVDGERNTNVSITLPYTASYQPAEAGGSQPLDGRADVVFPSLELTKPADAGMTALITIVVVLISALVPLGALLLMANLHRRLPDPDGRTVAEVALVADEGALHLAPGATLGDEDLRPIAGSRDRYDLPQGMAVTRRRTLNPFAEITAVVTSENGPVGVIPWMRLGEGRSVEIPAQFAHLVLLRSDIGSNEGVAIVVSPEGSTPAEAQAALTSALATTNRLWDRVSSALATPGRP